MGPYSEKRQLERAEAVARLLAHDNLSEWAKEYWSKVAATLCQNEATYNYRVREVYTKIRNSITGGWL